MGRRAEWRLIAPRFPLRFGRARFLACRIAVRSVTLNPVARARPRVRGGLAAGATAWRAFRPSELFDGRSALLFRSVSAVPSFGTFPQLDKSFPQIPEKLLTNVRGGAILISHLKPQGLPAERQTESARERCSGFAFRRDSGKPRQASTLGGLFLCLRRRCHFRASVEQAATRRLAMACGWGALPAVSAPWGRVWRGGGGGRRGADNRARSA